MGFLEDILKPPPPINVTKIVEVRDEPIPWEPGNAERWVLDLSLSSRELAALFALKGWQVQNASNNESVPGAAEIRGILVTLAESIAGGDASYNSTARFMAVRDHDFPSATELYLYIGNMSEKTTDDIDPDDLTEADIPV